ncbi:hypothetical protein [Parvularcula maris]|uniref:Uncharacterized protein n=1 Tax=Parvularcula maris TaxID=2965077 RepID=A0A9X2LAC8_9PROT|nr:hypothetical protein [Parvularcula maris]MCQ8186068.1 hypothetical protein [Parvularcula maris]
MSRKDHFFIGWSDETPAVDRRFLLGLSVLLLGSTGAAAYATSSRQNPAGPGTWDQGDIREWRGIVTSLPYPMLRYRSEDGEVRTALLGCQNKCVPELMIDQYRGQAVIVRGSPIRRGRHLMIATDDFGRWIEPVSVAEGDDELAFPEPEALGEAALSGMILDTKCWFGAMRPNSGKVHKSCAALCIKSGIPPAFYVRGPQNQRQLLIMTDENGAPVGEDILPFVADRISLAGSLERRGDVVLLRAATESMRRV